MGSRKRFLTIYLIGMLCMAGVAVYLGIRAVMLR
jgi:hypothetical protein